MAYDVEKGWDWTRVPGTTTVKLSLDEMVQSYMRHYQHSKLVGSVLQTSKNPNFSNGVFAMRFRQPDGITAANMKKNIEFTFRKSVVFYNSLIVCLGSDIAVKNSEPRLTQTTIFEYLSEWQNEMVKE